MAGVWILAENHEQTLGLLNAGRQIAEPMETSLTALLWQDHDLARNCIAHGADEVLLLPALAENQSLEACLPVIIEAVKKSDPDVFLLIATARGKELAARAAARLDAGLCSNCTALKYNRENGVLEMERLAYGGAAVQKLTCRTRPVMATVPAGTFDPAAVEEGKSGEIRTLASPPPSAVTVLAKKEKAREARDIGEAKAIVAVGRGFEKQADLAMARDLAAVLDGEIACTRPISEEMHWLPEEVCIGLSGVQVKPDLYLGLGVSGQIQHVTGIRNARIVCAVNKDENAPIFTVADFGIVGDLYDVAPRLADILKKRQE